MKNFKNIFNEFILINKKKWSYILKSEKEKYIKKPNILIVNKYKIQFIDK